MTVFWFGGTTDKRHSKRTCAVADVTINYLEDMENCIAFGKARDEFPFRNGSKKSEAEGYKSTKNSKEGILGLRSLHIAQHKIRFIRHSPFSCGPQRCINHTLGDDKARRNEEGS
jgi:hypothetical protein